MLASEVVAFSNETCVVYHRALFGKSMQVVGFVLFAGTRILASFFELNTRTQNTQKGALYFLLLYLF